MAFPLLTISVIQQLDLAHQLCLSLTWELRFVADLKRMMEQNLESQQMLCRARICYEPPIVTSSSGNGSSSGLSDALGREGESWSDFVNPDRSTSLDDGVISKRRRFSPTAASLMLTVIFS
jgi:hypothetical protein